MNNVKIINTQSVNKLQQINIPTLIFTTNLTAVNMVNQLNITRILQSHHRSSAIVQQN
jgi:hypothetical protein